MANNPKPGLSVRKPGGAKPPPGPGPALWRWAALAALIFAAGIAAWWFLAGESGTEKASNAEAAAWSAQFWQRPIPPQGAPPATYMDPARSLHPEDCGMCHSVQFEGWKDSLHAATMGPGVAGQFASLHPDEVTECHGCHAPLSEQYARLPSNDGLVANPAHDSGLAEKGLVCAACHLREHRRHGPPLPERATGVSSIVHGEPARTPFFESAEFCMGCHQHPDSAPKVNGKPIENTYAEWLASPQAAQGMTCQICHMPQRRHLWKGIHDRDMTRQGITIETRVEPESPRAGGMLNAVLRVTNTGTGHAFPTYTTPAVYLRAALLGADDRPLPGRYEEVILQRRLDMSTEPWSEQFDTRLLPGKSATLEFASTLPPEAVALYLWIWVDPDQFYRGFFRQHLEQGGDFEGRDRLQAALQETERRQYLLWSMRVPIER